MTPVKKNMKRLVKAVVISDVHMGTYACKAAQLTDYLKSIHPETLVLNGDIIDAWQFSKRYFPTAHIKLMREMLKMMEARTKIYYVAGNHDEMMRRFAGMSLGSFSVVNKVLLTLDGKRSWIFHGDVFDGYMHRLKWLARLGAQGYGMLAILNKAVEQKLRFFGKPKVSISKKLHNRINGGKKEISRFEETVGQLAISKGYDYAICGHTHLVEKKVISNEKGKVTYLNSGDWVESMTALEYYEGDWHVKYWEPSTETLKDEETMTEEHFSKPSKALFMKVFREVVMS